MAFRVNIRKYSNHNDLVDIDYDVPGADPPVEDTLSIPLEEIIAEADPTRLLRNCDYIPDLIKELELKDILTHRQNDILDEVSEYDIIQNKGTSGFLVSIGHEEIIDYIESCGAPFIQEALEKLLPHADYKTLKEYFWKTLRLEEDK